jgi:succinyl-diaminopimelate desuccinylase
MSASLELAKQLIAISSITPDDNGCLDVITARLEALGFCIERLDAGAVSNLWATIGSGDELLVFAGHTDVVPPGALTEWKYPPFRTH